MGDTININRTQESGETVKVWLEQGMNGRIKKGIVVSDETRPENIDAALRSLKIAWDMMQAQYTPEYLGFKKEEHKS